ncbi:MAG: flavodoxin reductase [Bacteroidetes bacterium]|nr:flavodoxin reductase [Bacteroidota bacterium]MBS1649597.1 flavodoxin reductase [Bacteroidota bacterium]
MFNVVKIKSIEHLTHDVLKIIAEKPANLIYMPGQAADISINKAGWEKELRAFTFTSLPEDNFIEFTIKIYPLHNGVTNQLLSLKATDELIIGDVFGDINYKGEGIFIAGGAGITPFMAILKHLEKENKIGNNKLIFANKTKADIIQEDKLNKLLGKNFINILSHENLTNYEYGFISAELIKKYMSNTSKYFYLCGPPPMMDAVEKHLTALGIAKEFIVKEAF